MRLQDILRLISPTDYFNVTLIDDFHDEIGNWNFRHPKQWLLIKELYKLPVIQIKVNEQHHLSIIVLKTKNGDLLY